MLHVNNLTGFGTVIDQYTKILLHFDGSNGSQTYTDSANPSRTWTASTNGALTTTGAKFGSACYSNPSSTTSAGMTAPDSSDFTLGIQDFTLDFWFKWAAGASGATIRAFGQNSSTLTNRSISGVKLAANTMNAGLTWSDASNVSLTTTTAPASDTWHHYALVRAGGSLLLFLNGVLEDSETGHDSKSVLDSPNAFGIGRSGELNSTQWRGQIDEFRLSVGIARWTAAFTPPTLAYTFD